MIIFVFPYLNHLLKNKEMFPPMDVSKKLFLFIFHIFIIAL